MEYLQERYKEIFAYLRRCECSSLASQAVAAKLKEFIDIDEKRYKELPAEYQNKLEKLKKYHKRLLIDISDK